MRKLVRAASLLALLAAPAAVLGQTATLVRDINTTTRSDGSSPSSAPARLLALGNKVLFTAGEPSSGYELWGSDGTAAGTQLLQDLCPGECSANVYPLGVVNGVAVGIVSTDEDDEEGQMVLWRSDGTRGGTYLLTPPGAPYTVSWPDEGGSYAFLGRHLYFQSCPPESRCEIWRTDGTLAGTRMVHRDPDAFLSGATTAGGKVFFIASTGSSWELWKTDGTTSSRVAELERPPYRITAAGDKLFFLLDSDGTEVWVSDGTKAGTRAVTQFQAPEPFDDPFDEHEILRAIGNRVYFVANDVLHGFEIWRSDGNPAQRVTDFGYFNAVEPRTPMAEVGGRLIFVASDGLTGQQLWTTDGKPESVRPLRDLCPGGCGFLSTSLFYLAPLGGKVLFFAQTTSGRELWSTDGTAAGTRRVKELCSGNCAPDHPSIRRSLPGEIFFTFRLYPGSVQLWRSDGTEAGTQKLFSSSFGEVGDMARAGARIFFGGPSSYGQELWVMEGGQTRLVTDISRPEPSSNPQELTALGDRLFFIAHDGSRRGVWQTSGSTETTVVVPETLSACSSGPARLQVVAGRLLFLQNDAVDCQLWSTDGQSLVQLTHFGAQTYIASTAVLPDRLLILVNVGGRPEMWTSDGTPQGTAEAFELPAELYAAEGLVTAGSEAYFIGFDQEGTEAWRTDGTVAGTRRVSDNRLYPSEFTRAGAQVFFVAKDDDFNTGLWKTNGTDLATPVRVPLGDDYDLPTELTEYQGNLYLFAPGPEGWSLWRSDGTEAGTIVLHPFHTHLDFQEVPRFGLTVFQGRLYFAADDGVHGTELWTSDGTAAGTRMVADLLPGPGSSSPSSLAVAAGKLWFAATDGLHGVELWRSDGTAAGTRLVQDLAPLAASSHPDQITAAGNSLYFVADDGATGRELWSLPLTGPASCQPSPTRLCLGNGRYQVDVVWRDFQNKTGPGRAVSLTSDTGYFWFFDASNVEVILKVLDGRGLNGHVWVFYGALSSVEYSITVTDTQTGLARRYFNPSGQLASVGDTAGFGPLGAYARTAPSIAAPSLPALVSERTDPAAAIVPCQPTATRLCLRDGRFAVESSWKDFQGKTGQGKAVSLSGDTGYFWFFDAANVEVVLKVLDGTPVNGKQWVFYGALSNVEYTLTVTDTQTGKVRTYKNPSGRFASVADTAAF